MEFVLCWEHSPPTGRYAYLAFGSFKHGSFGTVRVLPLRPLCLGRWLGAYRCFLSEKKTQAIHKSVQALRVTCLTGSLKLGSQSESDPMAFLRQMGPGGAEPGAERGESLSPSAVNRLLMEFLIYTGRAMAFFYPVYLTGYLGLSISWVLLCMLLFTWWKKNRQWKDARIGSAIDFVDNEKRVIDTELKSALQMASWVCMVALPGTESEPLYCVGCLTHYRAKHECQMCCRDLTWSNYTSLELAAKLLNILSLCCHDNMSLFACQARLDLIILLHSEMGWVNQMCCYSAGGFASPHLITPHPFNAVTHEI